MLSGILNSDIAIDTNIKIIRAFVSLRRIMSLPDTTERFNLIEKEIAFIKSEMEDTLEIQNDINESTKRYQQPHSYTTDELPHSLHYSVGDSVTMSIRDAVCPVFGMFGKTDAFFVAVKSAKVHAPS